MVNRQRLEIPFLGDLASNVVFLMFLTHIATSIETETTEISYRSYDPLTLDLGGDGIETVAPDGWSGSLFDMDNDGIRTATGWIKSDDGLLVFDRNGDGIINNGTELFGDHTPISSGGFAANGFCSIG